MKQVRFFKTAVAVLAGFLALTAVSDPVVSDVVVRQRWPWSRLVDIDYVVTCEESQRVDVTVQGYNGGTPLELPYESLSGDLYGVSQGLRRIVWDPAKAGYTNNAITQFRVELVSAVAIPTYMIVDLDRAVGDPEKITYHYCGSNVWYDVTNNTEYATTKLVMRRIPAGTFTMGENANVTNVILTQDYYMGVFEVTQKQWNKIVGSWSWPSRYTNHVYREARPVEQVSFNAIRGGTLGGGWPVNSEVDEGSFLKNLRNQTGLLGFDLPTEAQWEYACRAGTTTYYNDGEGTPLNTDSNAQMNVLGRYGFNGGTIYVGPMQYDEPERDCDDTNGTAMTGSYRPNRWGLYDMHGNVGEWCLNWAESDTARLHGGVDPVGDATGTKRIYRYGSYQHSGSHCRSAARKVLTPETLSRSIGFRLALNLP